MKYPIKSNWITYTRIEDTDSYYVHNVLLEEDCIVGERDICFINKLDGKTNPRKILKKYAANEVNNYLGALEENGLIRSGKTVIFGFLMYMKTIYIVRDNLRFQKIAWYLNIALQYSFLPMLLIGLRCFLCLANTRNFYEHLDKYFGDYYLVNCIIGESLGVILHELGHAIAATAYGSRVMEFGIMFQWYPSVYTLIDMDTVKNNFRKIQIDLAGIEMNFFLAGLAFILMSITDSYNWKCAGLWMGIAISNISFGMVNLLLIEGVDGMHVMEIILGNRVLEVLKNLVINKATRRRLFQKKNFNKKMLMNGSLIILFFISVVLVKNGKVHMSIVALLLVLFVVAINPVCNHRESVWIFFLMIPASIPLNSYFGIHYGFYLSRIISDALWVRIMCFLVIYGIAISVEQIVFGVIGRIIWKRQYKI